MTGATFLAYLIQWWIILLHGGFFFCIAQTHLPERKFEGHRVMGIERRRSVPDNAKHRDNEFRGRVAVGFNVKL
ncbi:MAG: hypothetical protein R2860_14820 [Desulfobacterales bacterium]